MNVSEIIKRHIRENGLKQKKIALLVGESESNFSQKLKTKDLNTDFICKISIACGYDFFAEISREFRKENKNIKSIASKKENSELEEAIIDVFVKRFPNILK
jgi:predicted transcriptional regulator